MKLQKIISKFIFYGFSRRDNFVCFVYNPCMVLLLTLSVGVSLSDDPLRNPARLVSVSTAATIVSSVAGELLSTATLNSTMMLPAGTNASMFTDSKSGTCVPNTSVSYVYR